MFTTAMMAAAVAASAASFPRLHHCKWVVVNAVWHVHLPEERNALESSATP